MRVRWNSLNSREFLLSNGVKQGRVLSSLLSSVYLDDLLCDLRQVNFGCHTNGLYVDDHHGPHHEAVMVRELCIAIDENRFTVLQLKRCVIWWNTYALYKYMKLHLYMVFYDGLSCALPMIIVRYMYTVYHYFLFSFDLLMFILE